MRLLQTLSETVFRTVPETKKTLNSSICLLLLWIWIRENQSAGTKGKWEHTLETHPASRQTHSHINRTKGVSFTSGAHCVWSHDLTSLLSFNETPPQEVHGFKQSLQWFLYMSPIAQQNRYKQKSCLTGSSWFLPRLWQSYSTVCLCRGISVYRGG